MESALVFHPAPWIADADLFQKNGKLEQKEKHNDSLRGSIRDHAAREWARVRKYLQHRDWPM